LIGGKTSSEGEIVIYGDNIGVGYWQDSESTSKSFREVEINNTFFPAYYTGDWAVYLEGKLFFSHRIDRQVKVKGNRVELDEIDFFVRSFGIKNCRTVFLNEKLYCFLETRTVIDVGSLKSFLDEHLPIYSVPAEFIILPNLPRNDNEKINIAWLKKYIEDHYQ
jgi:D-alanine--poly(phosphoribitol) ligase subunit 1